MKCAAAHLLETVASVEDDGWEESKEEYLRVKEQLCKKNTVQSSESPEQGLLTQ